MTRKAARTLAAAFRDAHRQAREQDGPGRYRATVTRWAGEDDFDLDVHGEDLALDDGDVTLAQVVRSYDAAVGVKVDDVLLLLEHDETYTAIAVVSDTEAAG